MREELEEALESNDPEILEKCLKECEDNGVTDEDGEVEKAKEMLPILQTNEGN